MTTLPIKKDEVDNPKIEDLEKVYTHKCFACGLLFNDVEPPHFLYPGSGSHWEIKTFDSTRIVSSCCKRCMQIYLDFMNKKIKTVSLPFLDDQLAIGGPCEDK
jgi:hypothetical protein